MISVVVVDDEGLVRSGFAALLASDPEMTVAGTAADGDAALAVIRRERPDVVLMDNRIPVATVSARPLPSVPTRRFAEPPGDRLDDIRPR